MNTRDLAIVCLAAALSAALSVLRLFQLPQGGSVALEIVPILYLSMQHGIVRGLAAGFLSGLAQLLLPPPPFIVHPIQILLDYPLAMAACGLAGIIRSDGSRWLARGRLAGYGIAGVGIVFAGGAKYCLHVLSGVIFFAAYAPEGQNVWVYSAAYNASYMALQVLLSLLLLPPLLRRAGRGKE